MMALKAEGTIHTFSHISLSRVIPGRGGPACQQTEEFDGPASRDLDVRGPQEDTRIFFLYFPLSYDLQGRELMNGWFVSEHGFNVGTL